MSTQIENFFDKLRRKDWRSFEYEDFEACYEYLFGKEEAGPRLITEGDKVNLLEIRKLIEKADKTDERFLDYHNQELLGAIDRASYNLENGLNYFKPVVRSEDRWFYAECEDCGWEGSSQYLLGGAPIADTGDHSDPECPVCGSVKIN